MQPNTITLAAACGRTKAAQIDSRRSCDQGIGGKDHDESSRAMDFQGAPGRALPRQNDQHVADGYDGRFRAALHGLTELERTKRIRPVARLERVKLLVQAIMGDQKPIR